MLLAKCLRLALLLTSLFRLHLPIFYSFSLSVFHPLGCAGLINIARGGTSEPGDELAQTLGEPRTHTRKRTDARTHKRTHSRTHARTNARTLARIHAYMHAHMHARVQARTHTHTHDHRQAQSYTQTHTHTLSHTHAHTHDALSRICTDSLHAYYIYVYTYIFLCILYIYTCTIFWFQWSCCELYDGSCKGYLCSESLFALMIFDDCFYYFQK